MSRTTRDLSLVPIDDLDLLPGDVLLISCTRPVTDEQVKMHAQVVRDAVPFGVKVIFARRDVRVEIIRNSSGDAERELEQRMVEFEVNGYEIFRND